MIPFLTFWLMLPFLFSIAVYGQQIRIEAGKQTFFQQDPAKQILQKSTDGGNSWFNLLNAGNDLCAWTEPVIVFDSLNLQIRFRCHGDSITRTFDSWNGGQNWSAPNPNEHLHMAQIYGKNFHAPTFAKSTTWASLQWRIVNGADKNVLANQKKPMLFIQRGDNVYLVIRQRKEAKLVHIGTNHNTLDDLPPEEQFDSHNYSIRTFTPESVDSIGDLDGDGTSEYAAIYEIYSNHDSGLTFGSGSTKQMEVWDIARGLRLFSISIHSSGNFWSMCDPDRGGNRNSSCLVSFAGNRVSVRGAAFDGTAENVKTFIYSWDGKSITRIH